MTRPVAVSHHNTGLQKRGGYTATPHSGRMEVQGWEGKDGSPRRQQEGHGDMNGVTEGWMELELFKVVACGRMEAEDEDEVKKEQKGKWEGKKGERKGETGNGL